MQQEREKKNNGGDRRGIMILSDSDSVRGWMGTGNGDKVGTAMGMGMKNRTTNHQPTPVGQIFPFVDRLPVMRRGFHLVGP